MTKNKFFTTKMVGPDCSPRYVIRDLRQSDPVFWNGLKWTRKFKKAMLFADMGNVWDVMYALTVALFRKRHRPRHFQFIVDVTVLGNATQEEVESYLRSAMRLRLDYDGMGIGPDDDSLVLLDIANQNLLPVQ